jgi:glycosyltransferase involved in cell wall biosynthesis
MNFMRSNNTVSHEILKNDKERPAGTTPTISVGLAVYNGENYVAQAIESILNQTLTDFELIITDNASTDRTSEICRTFAEKDSRIIYHKNTVNIGAVRNMNLVFSMARGKYFRWLGHDDFCAPETLAECTAVLDSDPSVVLCHTGVVEIDGTGKHVGRGPWCDASSFLPHERFRNAIKMNYECYEQYGVIRPEILRQARELQVYVDSDRTFLAELALYGRFQRLEKDFFFHRIHPQKSTVLFPAWRDRMIWYDPAFKTKITFPFWMQFIDYLKRIARVPLPFPEKIRCYVCMIGWLREGHGKSMVKDVLIAIQKTLFRQRRMQ